MGPGDDPADYTVSFYEANGTVGLEVPLDDPDVQFSIDAENGEYIYVISAANFPLALTDPDGGGSGNYEAYALTNTATSTVLDFYDIGGGTTNILAVDGLAAGQTSQNVPVLVGPNATTTTLQFNQPDPDTLTYGTVGPGDTGPACFAKGTLIDTPHGPRLIEDLRTGDCVTVDGGPPKRILWVGSGRVDGRGRHAPVRIRPGVLGATRDVLVSPQHRVLIHGWHSELLFAEPTVFVPALALINGTSVTQQPMAQVDYFHILLDQHAVLTTSGLKSESLFPACDHRQRPPALTEAMELIPALRQVVAQATLAHPCPPQREARAISGLL